MSRRCCGRARDRRALRGSRQPATGSRQGDRPARTFADQAVIAIQNARLFNETREALEQQTATADVLHCDQRLDRRRASRCSSRSCESCQRLFESHDRRHVPAGRRRPSRCRRQRRDRARASRSALPPPARVERRIAGGCDSRARVCIRGHPRQRRRARLRYREHVGDRQQLDVSRRCCAGAAASAPFGGPREPAPFIDKEIGLLRTFADQAVIAIQNARLFNETREALRKVELRTAELSESLDYQTAISDVLRVISQSPTDVSPVFEAILDSASRLFGSPHVAPSSASTAGSSTWRRRATGRPRRSPTRAASIRRRRTRRC